MEDLYSIVEFEDGLQMIPSSWLTENKTAARWPQFTSHARFIKAVQKRILYDNSWFLYDVKRILATAQTYEKGLIKLKKAEFVSDINSESDSENLKKSRKDRAKRMISSSDTDGEEILPPLPTIPQTKTTCNKKINYSKPSQELTENITTIFKEKELEKLSTHTNISKMKRKEIHHDLVADNDEEINENENSLYNSKSFGKFYKSNNDASSNTSYYTFDFQRYIIRKLTDMGFKMSSLDEQQKLINNKLNTILQRIETFNSNENIQENEIREHLMDNFPIDTIEDLEQFEKSLIEGSINRKELIKQLSQIGGNDVRGVTYNLLRKLMSDKLASKFSYVGGKKKQVFYDLQLRKIIFSVVRNQFAETTDHYIAEPIKSWLRHANERHVKKIDKETRTDLGVENKE
ncbi:uncharacterized protein [Linepithema humile]|uniref:uncharacterized protein n=1 Tax=Linepithema humile TaxID=83485 RepID=UPI00351F3BC4